MNNSRKQILSGSLFAAILLSSTIFKVLFIGRKELWLDETYSCFVVSRSFSEMMNYIKGDVHPPFYYLLLKSWSTIFGLSPYSVKSLSIVISIVASIIFYFLVMKIIRVQWISLFCFFLFQFSPILFYYSVESRMYMLGTLFCVISLYYFYDLIHSDNFSYKSIFMFSIGCACLFYVHYVGIFLILGYLAYYIISPVNRELKGKYVLYSAIIVILLTAPWYQSLYNQKVKQADHSRAFIIAKYNPQTLNYMDIGENKIHTALDFRKIITSDVETIASLLGVYPYNGGYLTLFLNISFIIIIIYYIYLVWKKNEVSRALFVVMAGYCLTAMYFHFHSRRLYILLTPILITVIGVVVLEIHNKYRNKMISVILALSVSVLYFAGTVRVYNKNYNNMNTKIVKYIQSNFEKNDVVIFNSLYYEVPFDYYARRVSFTPKKRGFPISIYEWWNKQAFKGWGGPIISIDELERFVDGLRKEANIGSVWLILFENNYYDPKNKLLQYLKEHAVYWDNCGIQLYTSEREIERAYGLYRIKLTHQ